MNRRVLRPLAVSLFAAGLLAAGVFVVADASSARFWRVSTQADLLKGQSERLSIDYDGRLVLGPSTRSVFAPTSPFVWCLAAGPDGSVYAGGGNDGLVWHVDRDGKTRVAFDAQELEVHAIATAADGALLVGDLARRQGLPRRRRRLADGVLRSGGQVHLGARRWTRRAASMSRPETRVSSTACPPTARARCSTGPRPPMSRRCSSAATARSWRAPSRRDEC